MLASVCANYALQWTADNNEDNYGTEVANTLRRNFYLDDFLKSASTEDKAIDLVKDVKAVCRNEGFNLTKLVGNTDRIINATPVEHRAENVKSLSSIYDPLGFIAPLVLVGKKILQDICPSNS